MRNLPPATALRRTRVISACELSVDEMAEWSALQSRDPLLASPFLCPEFTKAVADVRKDARVAIVEDAEGAAGFFPFQMGSGRRGFPIGGPLSDCQGVVMRPGWAWNAHELVRSCGLGEWHFDHLIASQTPFDRYHYIPTESPIIDLSGGYARYFKERIRLLSEPRKRRKLEREVGPVRFEIHCHDVSLLKKLMHWKANQYVDTGKLNIFTIPWVVEVIDRIHATQAKGFSGLFSVLYAGDEPIAAHMGMRSETVWHYWFPAYNPNFARYSPGMLLLVEMVGAAPLLGLKSIDLGKGKALYKHRLHNSSIALAEGSVPAAPLPCAKLWARDCCEGMLRSSSLIGPARKLHSWYLQVENQIQFVARARNRRRFR